MYCIVFLRFLRRSLLILTIFGNSSLVDASQKDFKSANILEVVRTSDWLDQIRGLSQEYALQSTEEASFNFLLTDSDQVLMRFLQTMRRFRWTLPQCDLKHKQMLNQVTNQSTLIMQLFEPLDLRTETHVCLSRLRQVHAFYWANEESILQLARGLDFGYRKSRQEELLFYLWFRRITWNAFIPDFWKDITPPNVAYGEYSKLVAHLMQTRSVARGNTSAIHNVDEIASLNIELLKLMHPLNWRFDPYKGVFFTETMRYKNLLGAARYKQIKNQLIGSPVNQKIEKMILEDGLDSKVLYCSKSESKLLQERISGDVNGVISRLRSQLKIKELILTNLMFAWERDSFDAFRVILKGSIKDFTYEAIQDLHKNFGIAPSITQNMIEILVEQKIVNP